MTQLTIDCLESFIIMRVLMNRIRNNFSECELDEKWLLQKSQQPLSMALWTPQQGWVLRTKAIRR